MDRLGGHVSVFLYMMRGEFNDHLSWPFRGEVRVQLLNQRRDEGHREIVILGLSDYSCPCTSRFIIGLRIFKRVVGCERGENGWGHSKFVGHKELSYNVTTNCQYLANDSLKFRISKIVVDT